MSLKRASLHDYFYRPQTKFAKVMFLQVSVCPHGGWGSMRGFIRGACVVLFGGAACMVLFRGACMVLFGGCAWFYLGGMHGFIWGACMVLFGGHAWFYSGGVHTFIWGACVVLFRGACVVFSGGACMVFSVFSDTMRYGQ